MSNNKTEQRAENYRQLEIDYIAAQSRLATLQAENEKLWKLLEEQRWIPVTERKPTEYGKYEIYREKCGKTHYETWNNTGWAYNNNDITHWRHIVNPPVWDAFQKANDLTQNKK